MRKVLSFVLVLSLVLGSFGMAFAAPLSDVKGEDCADAVSVLTELGVVSGYPDGTYKPDNIVTRAEMAVIVVRALGLANYATGTSSFSDMAGHWSNAYVAYATSLGIIDGYPDGTFRPDNTVSYDEAAKMLVAALGYTPESLPGTWPANYVVKAQALG
ncbi:MAG: S-layer homology domain-containing protein, partial [Clostridiales Family XIII bacterium]|nr:S-layer homology domain-containing protein [Clostridiales Family XIII bacterium]